MSTKCCLLTKNGPRFFDRLQDLEAYAKEHGLWDEENWRESMNALLEKEKQNVNNA